MNFDSIKPPRSAMDVFSMLPEGTHAEVIENQLYMAPAPTFDHQDMSMSLSIEMGSYIREHHLGKLVATVNVHLDEDNIFEPDLVFLSNENLHLIDKNGQIYGAPDLVIEILSPSNKHYDLETKKKVYERCSVAEYRIIDPVTKESLEFSLSGKKYAELPSSKGKLKSKLLKKTFHF